MTNTPNPYDIPGPIAEKYDMLQGLPHLKKAHEAYPVEPASHTSTIKAVMQASTIALLNMQDLMARAAEDMKGGDVAAAATKREWEARFSRVLNDISRIPERIAVAGGSVVGADMNYDVNIIKTPAFDEYFSSVRSFDQETKKLDIDTAIATGSMNDPTCRLVQHTRLSAYDALAWERNLRRTRLKEALTTEELHRFMGANHLKDAVHVLASKTPALKDATFFNQFRGLHQIPEILVHEQNDHLEQAIKDVRTGHFRQALEHMAVVEALFEPIVGSVRNMAETLTTDDYHRFRKHLGLTSGSQSEEIRHRLFIKNYKELWKAVKEAMAGESIQHVDAHRYEDNYHLKHQLLNSCLQLRTSIVRWKDSHLHLARSMLGSGGTKSLIGSPDAIEAVIQMFEASHGKNDPMRPLLDARGLDVLSKSHAYAPLAKEMQNPDSLIAEIEKATGGIAQKRFTDVQYETGRYRKGSKEPIQK